MSTMKKSKAHGIHCLRILSAQNAAAVKKNIKTWWSDYISGVKTNH
jgi:hypothetical protein